MIIPRKLAPGMHLRIISPACTLPSMPWFGADLYERAKAFFTDRGFVVSEGAHLRDIDPFGSTSIDHRLKDLHEAFSDTNVDALVTIRGGWNCNQLLPYIDYDLIRKNPKILCGFSDITALGNAIFAMTDLITYSGPNFNQFAYGDQLQYTHDYFETVLMKEAPVTIHPSKTWTDMRYEAGKPWDFEKNDGWWRVHDGEAEGISIGGNLCTFLLLQGTKYMPKVDGSVLFLEDDYETHPRTFDRDLTSITQQPWFEGVRGILFGRFQKKAVHEEFGPVTKEFLHSIIENNPRLGGLPIIANVDFGHTHPIITFPIGGWVKMRGGADPVIEIIKH